MKYFQSIDLNQQLIFLYLILIDKTSSYINNIKWLRAYMTINKVLLSFSWYSIINILLSNDLLSWIKWITNSITNKIELVF